MDPTTECEATPMTRREIQTDTGNDENCWKSRTLLEKRFIVGSSVLGLLLLICLIIIAVRKTCVQIDGQCTTKTWSKTCVGSTEECTTDFCVQAAAELLEFIDLERDPCDDFYNFTCGTYYKNAIKSDVTSPWVTARVLFKNEMKSLVVDSIGKNDTNAQIAMKQFYRACMNETAIEEDDNRTFMDAINKLGGWPMVNGTDWDAEGFDWVEWYIRAKQMGLPVNGFFGFKRMSTNANNTILRITGPNVEFSFFLVGKMKSISEAFKVKLEQKEANELNVFIKELYKHRAKYEPKEMKNNVGDDDYDGRDGVDKQKGFVITSIENLTKICSVMPWLRILNGISGNSSQFDNSSEVIYYAGNIEGYCDKLKELLQKTHSRIVANYYIWSVIQNAHIYMDKDIRSAFQEWSLFGNDPSIDRFDVCYSETVKRFKYVRETIYIREKTSPQVKQQLKEMINIMKDIYVEHLKKSNWMDFLTKITASKKARIIESFIGGDDELYDIDKFDNILGVDGLKFTSTNMFKILQEKMIKEDHHLFHTIGSLDWEPFFKEAVQVNVFFIQTMNVMFIPAPILVSVFYNKDFPAYMNYGFMGSTIAHEFMHGFSKEGRYILLEDDTLIDWWTFSTEYRYNRRIQCVIDEYESFPFRYRLNGTLTLNENVADYVGADLGYEAYRRYIEKHGVELKLPGVPLTPEQIYWVKASTNYCFRKLDDEIVDLNRETEHAIPAFRVQAPAKNSHHFAEAFHCPVGSPMNPRKKCQIL